MADNSSDELKRLMALSREKAAALKAELAGKDELQRRAIKEDSGYKERVKVLKEINEQIQEQNRLAHEGHDTLIQQEKSARALKGIYGTLGDMEHQRVIKQSQAVNMDKDAVDIVAKIAELNQTLGQLSREDIVQRNLALQQIEKQYELLGPQRGIHSHIVANLKRQTAHADQLSNLTEKQKNFLEKQVAI